MTPLAYIFACWGIVLFGAPLLAVMIVLDQWIKRRSPLEDDGPEEDERPPRRNFAVLQDPLTAEDTDEEIRST